MKIAFKPSAIKELRRIPGKIQRSILEKIEALAQSSRPQGCLRKMIRS